MSVQGGEIALCVASGPSATASDVAAVRPFVDFTVCANDAWRLAPDADYLYAADRRWWRQHFREVRRHFAGQLRTSNEWAHFDHRIPLVRCDGRNSGIRAMRLALQLGARRIYLIGYDFCRSATGMKHFFGDHPRPLPNTSEDTFPAWVEEMRQFSVQCPAKVVNLSRRTAIDCFQRGEVL